MMTCLIALASEIKPRQQQGEIDYSDRGLVGGIFKITPAFKVDVKADTLHP